MLLLIFDKFIYKINKGIRVVFVHSNCYLAFNAYVISFPS